MEAKNHGNWFIYHGQKPTRLGGWFFKNHHNFFSWMASTSVFKAEICSEKKADKSFIWPKAIMPYFLDILVNASADSTLITGPGTFKNKGFEAMFHLLKAKLIEMKHDISKLNSSSKVPLCYYYFDATLSCRVQCIRFRRSGTV